MAFHITLAMVRAGGSLGKTTDEYLLRYLHHCGPVFKAQVRTFRTPAALLQAAAETRKRDAAVLWLMDGTGESLSSERFAERLRHTRDSGHRHVLLAVGPADGWTAQDRAHADLLLSLGPMTLPHELAALVLAEQIYRASTILQGHPYHLGH